MNEPLDPFEILRALNPVDPADLRGERSSTRACEAREQIVNGMRPSRGQTRLRWRLPRLRWRRSYVLALVPLAAVVAAGAWALTHGATKQLTIGCYASAALQARTIVVAATAASPTEACGRVWQRGDFGSSGSPRLQACVLPSGGVGVFPSPGGRACEQLKLAPVAVGASSISPQSGSAATLKRALVEEFLSKPCMRRGQAISTVRRELRTQHLNDWTVRATGAFVSARPCASLGFDEEQHLVLLVPMPKRP
jgi:hypothetical protein